MVGGLRRRISEYKPQMNTNCVCMNKIGNYKQNFLRNLKRKNKRASKIEQNVFIKSFCRMFSLRENCIENWKNPVTTGFLCAVFLQNMLYKNNFKIFYSVFSDYLQNIFLWLYDYCFFL